MVDLDLDIIMGKQPTVKIFGKEVSFKDLTVGEYLKAEHGIQKLDEIPMDTEENIAKATEVIYEYLFATLEITKAEAKKVSIAQFRAIRTYIARKDLYDQGFTDADIDKMEREALKKQASQILNK
jgi:hypothetical protein